MSEHGTIARYQKHYRDGESACDACKVAAYAYKREHERWSPERLASMRAHARRRYAAVKALIAMHPGDFQRLLTQQRKADDEPQQ